MRIQKTSRLIAMGLMLLVASSNALAERGNGDLERRGPPPESLEACSGLNLDQACSFTSPRRGEVSGTCIIPKNDESVLACKPERGGKHREKKQQK